MNKKLAIVKILANDGRPTAQDLEKWHKIFADQSMTEQEAIETGEVEIEYLPNPNNEHNIILVKIGDENYKPTFDDLENWRKVFEEAELDPDFKIFTHPAVEINVIPIDKIIAVE